MVSPGGVSTLPGHLRMREGYHDTKALGAYFLPHSNNYRDSRCLVSTHSNNSKAITTYFLLALMTPILKLPTFFPLQ